MIQFKKKKGIEQSPAKRNNLQMCKKTNPDKGGNNDVVSLQKHH